MKRLPAIVILLVMLSTAACAEDRVDTLTYVVYPYLPDAGYYQEIIERRWAEIEPDIRLVRARWDCYLDGAPEGIDVVMYDAVTRDALIGAGWIQPIAPEAVRQAGDILSFALEGLTVDGRLYGIPVLLCGSFLIYDQAYTDLAGSEHLTDFADESEILVINSRLDWNRPQFIQKVLADTLGEANPTAPDGADALMALIDRLAIEAYQAVDDAQVAAAYDAGSGRDYIGFSESLRLLKKRLSRTEIKPISFSDRAAMPRMYVDAAAVSSRAQGERYEKCIELVNVMAEAEVLAALSVQNGVPQ